MPDLNELYQQVILDHNRRPCHFHALENASHRAEGFNPLCGDRITVFLRMDKDRIEEISFQGSGCAISKASASLMTTLLKGKQRSDAEDLFQKFHRLVTGEKITLSELGKLAVFSGVSEFPVRVKCATLAWHTLKAALQARQEPISTE